MNTIIEIPDESVRKIFPTISMKDLKDGCWYVGRTYQRGMPIGQWDSHKEVFQCIKPPQFGQFSIYEMNHIEKDNGFVLFDPVIQISL